MNDAIRNRINLLKPLLKDSDPEVRSAAARAIEHLEVNCDIDEILHALKTGSMGARISAIHALGEIGGEKVIAPLVYCAGRSEADIRSAAVETLGRLAIPSTLPVLLERLDDDNKAVQARAVTALGRFPSSVALCERLRPFLEEQDGSIEAEAAIALARLGDQASAAGMCALLSSPHASTRMAAASAISLLPVA
jgi:HEAT repeat protein